MNKTSQFHDRIRPWDPGACTVVNYTVALTLPLLVHNEKNDICGAQIFLNMNMLPVLHRMRCMECYMRSSQHLTVVQSIFVSAAPFIVAVILMILFHIHRSGFMSLMHTTVLKSETVADQTLCNETQRKHNGRK
ncbi:uncharacterized protein F5147DRAFT_760564 [Suillus discolor]|uniref:Uncharacterized protein n=1 Tax=Suillus discolor TaxID=1912936 RepID=A0A9P7F9K5_9AGAM|nr:uncharacterized protein F5147DRAFT_760564 [Suillus discolor]KAG2109579.1 hypothetical protein F5147DRAFT_760564 [Suillus discolor]